MLGRELDAYGNRTQTHICIDPDAAYLGKSPAYLPDRSSVEYRLELGEIEVRLVEGEVQIMATGYGRLAVTPSSSNTLSLLFVEDK